ncbi:hypothetical protein ABT126_26265 [Streptomyces sp. NPDC002012]|uniref:hypothetical protein n=1 Tax=Streptomyces sp. NPDC002012 TaxID=3154532 RepID=UPI0033219A5A
MGLDSSVLIADWSWLGEVPPRERLARLHELPPPRASATNRAGRPSPAADPAQRETPSC